MTHWLLKRYQILWRNEQALRGAFFLEVASMMFTNFTWLIMLVLFVRSAGGTAWSSADILALHGINTLAFGVAFSLADGAPALGQWLRRGNFDRQLLQPKFLLLSIFSGHINITTLADVVFGSLLLSAYFFLVQPAWGWFGAFLALVVPLSVIMTMVSLAISSLTFFFPAEQNLKILFRFVWQPAFFPLDAFPGAMKIIFTVIFPSLIVAGWPVEALRTHSALIMLLIWLAAGVWWWFGAWVFYKGLSRYESGNGIG